LKPAGAFPVAAGSAAWLKLTTPALWLAVATACGFLLVSSRRGLDGTDEAAWVLCAANPWQSPGWGIFFGYFLHPIWQLGFDHLAGFRVAGIVVLLAVTYVFAKALGRILGDAGVVKTPHLFSWMLPTLLAAALGRYSIGTRTPSYDWVLLVGGLLFATGWLWLESKQDQDVPWAGIWLGSLGLLVAAVGKWTSFPGYLILFSGLFFHKFLRTGKSLRCAALFFASFLFWVAIFVLYATPAGIRSTWDAGWSQLQTGSHDGLIGNYALGLVKGFWQVVRAFPHVVVLFGLLWLVFKWVRKQKPNWAEVATATFLAGVVLVLARGHGLGGTTTFSKGMMVTLVWLSGVAFLLIPLRRTGSSPVRPINPSLRRVLALFLFLPWVNGLGTATGITDYLAHGIVFFVAGGSLLLALGVRRGLTLQCAAAAFFAIGIIHATRAASSTFNSYRLGSVWVEMAPVSSGPEQGKLLDYPQNVEALQAIDGDLRRLGFQSGDPIVGITDLAGLVYLLGGTSPGCCWYMGFWLQENTGVRAHLSRLTPETLARTWVLMRENTKVYEQLDVVWPKEKRVPAPQLLEMEYLWPWGDGAGVLQPLKVYRPSALAAP